MQDKNTEITFQSLLDTRQRVEESGLGLSMYFHHTYVHFHPLELACIVLNGHSREVADNGRCGDNGIPSAIRNKGIEPQASITEL